MRTTIVVTMAILLTVLAFAPVAAAATVDAAASDTLDAPRCGTLAGIRCADGNTFCQVYLLGYCAHL